MWWKPFPGLHKKHTRLTKALQNLHNVQNYGFFNVVLFQLYNEANQHFLFGIKK